jgi:hypothetical protein
VKYKKSSARRKNPFLVRLFQFNFSDAASFLELEKSASSSISRPPAEGNCAAAAIPCSRVDLPVPFSPANIVIGASKEREWND